MFTQRVPNRRRQQTINHTILMENDTDKASDIDHSPLGNSPPTTISLISCWPPGLHSSASNQADLLQRRCERQPLTNKNKTDPGNLGKSLDPVYQSVNQSIRDPI
ncbi:hypothetical protein T265_09774 [Opisthorchis viverrini]|uniref:Uncharacterized protein n=1 Tax=Opisthorchis viverrini TaxID=6198 RepID=A0A074ZFK8_OPIVI|nr:hypothetical protein T265_09774 [Opisthorchis viverrini]KER22020.1 hypothetical protein T265_09774 [Opisthorchis viverrini]